MYLWIFLRIAINSPRVVVSVTYFVRTGSLCSGVHIYRCSGHSRPRSELRSDRDSTRSHLRLHTSNTHIHTHTGDRSAGWLTDEWQVLVVQYGEVIVHMRIKARLGHFTSYTCSIVFADQNQLKIAMSTTSSVLKSFIHSLFIKTVLK